MSKLVVKDLHKSYVINEGFGRRSRVHALRDLNLEVSEGELVTVIGPSGCGKSTFLMVVAGIHPFDSGTLHLDGKPISEPGLDRGVVFQDFALFAWMTVRGNVKFGLSMKGMPEAEQDRIAEHYLRLVNLQEFADVFPHRLSGGMKQRVGIARAMATEPEILLMDEPFGSLDAQTRKSLQVQLLDIWRETKKTIVFITHSVREAVFLSQKVVVLSSRPGRVVETIPIDLSYEDRVSLSDSLMEYERRLENLIEQQIEDDFRMLPNEPMSASKHPGFAEDEMMD
ncbi:MAG: ABC transporter ATP-binding protein [Nitrospinota bacterium]|jgi:NitT/TauT family transport system ATP-binding protein|nr:ABC transporter ATP-binding protein [Nitrospinota bacterium]MDP7371266.1 ABC transporter ATP-binding protein [Nitrospinota bacterium]MDP7504868.1 ABC transporter ATP-binding protein [Nitrospinota bacterium]